MKAAEALGWTLDDLHERVAACEALTDGIAELDAETDDTWAAHASLAFLRIADELLSLGKEFRPPVPAPMLRRIRKLDEKLEAKDVAAVANRLRAWLLRQEGDLPATPDLDTAPLVEAEGADNLVSLPRGAYPSNEKERLRGLRTERWVALPKRTEIRKRSLAAREALGGLALVLAAANGDDDVPFGTLDRKRLALVVDAARQMLGGPLAERGLLRSVLENAALVERQGATPPVRSTAKRARLAVELLLSDLG